MQRNQMRLRCVPPSFYPSLPLFPPLLPAIGIPNPLGHLVAPLFPSLVHVGVARSTKSVFALGSVLQLCPATLPYCSHLQYTHAIPHLLLVSHPNLPQRMQSTSVELGKVSLLIGQTLYPRLHSSTRRPLLTSAITNSPLFPYPSYRYYCGDFAKDKAPNNDKEFERRMGPDLSRRRLLRQMDGCYCVDFQGAPRRS